MIMSLGLVGARQLRHTLVLEEQMFLNILKDSFRVFRLDSCYINLFAKDYSARMKLLLISFKRSGSSSR